MELNLTPPEAARRLRVSTQTLANWRVQGRGPRFLKLGSKVLYPLTEIVKFEATNLKENTAQGAR